MSLILGQRSNAFDPFSLDWDPFQGLLRSVAGTGGARDESSAVADARVDWKETGEAHVFRADLPGVRKEEVRVEVEEGNVLRISGERRKEQEEEERWHRAERSFGRFQRRFRLPENAKVEEVKATMENGVLTVVVPKEIKKIEVKSVEISGGAEQ